jgi:hypothetical protein
MTDIVPKLLLVLYAHCSPIYLSFNSRAYTFHRQWHLSSRVRWFAASEMSILLRLPSGFQTNPNPFLNAVQHQDS